MYNRSIVTRWQAKLFLYLVCFVTFKKNFFCSCFFLRAIVYSKSQDTPKTNSTSSLHSTRRWARSPRKTLLFFMNFCWLWIQRRHFRVVCRKRLRLNYCALINNSNKRKGKDGKIERSVMYSLSRWLYSAHSTLYFTSLNSPASSLHSIYGIRLLITNFPEFPAGMADRPVIVWRQCGWTRTCMVETSEPEHTRSRAAWAGSNFRYRSRFIGFSVQIEMLQLWSTWTLCKGTELPRSWNDVWKLRKSQSFCLTMPFCANKHQNKHGRGRGRAYQVDSTPTLEFDDEMDFAFGVSGAAGKSMHIVIKVLKKDFKDSCDGLCGPDWVLLIFINPNTSLHSVVFLSTFRSDCAAFIRMTNGRLAETGTFKVFSKKLALVKTSHNKLKVQKKWKMLHKKK